MPTPRPLRAGLLGAVAAVSTSLGCSDKSPTGPAAVPTFSLSGQQALAFAGVISDVHDRVLPGLGEEVPSAALQRALSDLSAALANRSRPELLRAISSTEEALGPLSGTDERLLAVQVDLDAVRLLVLEARRLLKPAAEQ